MRYKKLILIFSIILISTMFTVFFSTTVKADAKIVFHGQPTYYCYQTTSAGYYYYINVTLCNNGDAESVPINIGVKELIGEEYEYIYPEDCSEQIFSPDECKAFTIDWPSIYETQDIEIVYSASDIKDQNMHNTGSFPLTVSYNQATSDNKTPGFELCIFLFAIIFLLCSKKFKI